MNAEETRMQMLKPLVALIVVSAIALSWGGFGISAGRAVADEKDTFEVRVVGKDFSAPTSALQVAIDVNGNVFDIDGHMVGEGSLKSALADGSRKDVCHVRITLHDEQKTTLKAVRKAIAVIRKNAAPGRRTVVYVYSSED
jgi:hypothetical protein